MTQLKLNSQFYFIALSGSLHVGLFAISLLMGRSPVIITDQPVQIELLEASQPASTVVQKKVIKTQKLKIPSEIQSSPVSSESAKVTSPTPTSSISTGFSQSGIKDSYTKDLLVMIHQRKVYPRLAQKMGHRGRLIAQLRVSQDGRIIDSKIVEPSPHTTLNEAAEKLMKSLPRLKPFPEDVKDQEWVFNIPIDYKIE